MRHGQPGISVGRAAFFTDLAETVNNNRISYTLRKATTEDLPFERELFASTREDLRMLDLDRMTIDNLINQQFDAQRQYYTGIFGDAEYYIIVSRRKSIGRLIVARREKELHGIDIALLPPYRNQSIGTHIIRKLCAEALRKGQQMRIHVLESNRARRLYGRLGFVETGAVVMNHLEMIYSGEEGV